MHLCVNLQRLIYVSWRGHQTTTEYCIWLLCSKLFFDALSVVPLETVITKVEKLGKGIIPVHDFQKHTGEALPTLLSRLKAGGFPVMQMKAKAPVQTLAEYDMEVVKDAKLPTASARPVGSVVDGGELGVVMPNGRLTDLAYCPFSPNYCRFYLLTP
jgi:hypothetical protein